MVSNMFDPIRESGSDPNMLDTYLLNSKSFELI